MDNEVVGLLWVFCFGKKKTNNTSLSLFSASCSYCTMTCYYLNLVKLFLINLCVRSIKCQSFLHNILSLVSYCNELIISVTHLDHNNWWGLLQILLGFIEQWALSAYVSIQKPSEVNRRTLEQVYKSFSEVVSCCFFFFVAAGCHLKMMTKGKKRGRQQRR